MLQFFRIFVRDEVFLKSVRRLLRIVIYFDKIYVTGYPGVNFDPVCEGDHNLTSLMFNLMLISMIAAMYISSTSGELEMTPVLSPVVYKTHFRKYTTKLKFNRFQPIFNR